MLIRNFDGKTPLHDACQQGHRDTVHLLLQHGAKVSKQSTCLDLKIFERQYYRSTQPPSPMFFKKMKYKWIILGMPRYFS